MNASRRKQVEKAQWHLDKALEILNDVQAEEQEAYDNMPESLQSGERGELSSAYLEKIETLISAIEEDWPE
jgi:hypothetical protein